MVLLTMTPSIVEGLEKQALVEGRGEARHQPEPPPADGSPSLENPAVGKPISHGQVVDLWQSLKAQGVAEFTLEKLLQGAGVYVPPKPPKPEPSDEYKALMARLRREEEERQYQRMINPPPPMESFSDRFPSSSTLAHTFAEVNRPSKESDFGDDEITYNEIHRQLMLVLNFVLTIFGSAGALWMLARWWSTPARLFLTMAGSLIVAIAEVAVYSGYIWHLTEAKKKDVKLQEVKEVVQTWVVGGEDEPAEKAPVRLPTGSQSKDSNIRRRKKEPS